MPLSLKNWLEALDNEQKHELVRWLNNTRDSKIVYEMLDILDPPSGMGD